MSCCTVCCIHIICEGCLYRIVSKVAKRRLAEMQSASPGSTGFTPKPKITKKDQVEPAAMEVAAATPEQKKASTPQKKASTPQKKASTPQKKASTPQKKPNLVWVPKEKNQSNKPSGSTDVPDPKKSLQFDLAEAQDIQSCSCRM